MEEDFEASRLSLDKAIAYGQEDAVAYSARSRLKIIAGELEGAREDAGISIEKKENSEAYRSLAVIEYLEENVDASLEYLEQAQNLDPTVHDILLEIGYWHQKRGALSLAKSYYFLATACESSSYLSHIALLEIYRKAEETEKALEISEKFLQKEPKHPDMLFMQGLLLAKMGKNEKACISLALKKQRKMAWRKRRK